MRIPETKNGKTHYLPLPEPVLKILRDLPRQLGNDFVFCGGIEGERFKDLKRPWRRVCKRAEISDLRIHDLRRTCGSWLAQAGNSLHLVGRVLNHSSQASTAVYARFAQDNIRTALEGYANQLSEVIKHADAEDKSTAKVIKFG